MRTLYIALIFVGCLSLALGVDPVPFPYDRQPAANCTNNQTTATGCTTCNTSANECTAADTEKGYFLNGTSKQAAACPRACKKCTNETTCEECNGEGFTNTSCTECKSGFSYDNENTPAMSGICIGVDKNSRYTCAKDFFWDRTPNVGRKCVSKTANCQTGYANTAGSTASQNCDKCATDYLNITSQAQFSDNSWYWTYTCIPKPTVTPRPAPVQCNGTESVTGCKKCEGPKNCSQADAGYFRIATTTGRLRNLADTVVNYTGLIGICPSQCQECDKQNSCSKCGGTGYSNTRDDVTEFCKCDSAAGYTSSIPWTNVTKGSEIWYTCVSQALNQSCNATYTYSSYLPTLTDSADCLDPKNNNECYTDKRNLTGAQTEFSLTSFWDRVPNPQRKCVLATSKQCADGYAVEQNWTKSQSETDLKGNCGLCIVGLTLSGEQGNQVCQSSTSILVMSLAFLGVLLALVF